MRKILLFTVFCFFAIASRAQWISQNAGFSNKTLGFYEFSIVDKNTVWAICYDGVGGLFGPARVLDFTRTTNGGATWTAGQMGTDTSLAFSNICALSATEAWVSMHKFGNRTGGGIFHTTDGGVTWSQSGAGSVFDTASYPNFVYFKDPMRGIAGGDANGGYFEIYTTINGGITWTRTPQANIPAFVPNGDYGWFDGFAVVGDTVWFGNSRAQMYKSTDFGKTWSVHTMSSSPYTVYEIAFNDDGQHGLSHLRSGSSTFLFSTSDGGVTWTQLPSHPKWKQSRITSVPGTNIFVSTSTNSNSTRGSSYTSDYGVTWIEIDNATSKAACRFLDRKTGWSGSYFINNPGFPVSGGIYKWDSTRPLALAVPSPEIQIPRIYPNPAADKFRIELPVGNAGFDLGIYNAAGTLLKEVRITASRDVDIADLPAGVYTIRSGTSSEFNQKIIKQ
jgi:photosystem II stability/assembly factor-like uncharacterized protein